MNRTLRRRSSILAVLCLGLLLLLPAPTTGLEPDRRLSQYVVRNWGVTEGLPTATTWDIAQTADGYLWIATEVGLVRFDGHRFVLLNRTNIPGFEGRAVRAVHVDSHGVLWAGLAGGGLLRRSESGGFERVGPLLDIVALVEMPPGKLWIGADEGLFELPLGDAPGELSRWGDLEGLTWVGPAGSLLWAATKGEPMVALEPREGALIRSVEAPPGATASASVAVEAPVGTVNTIVGTVMEPVDGSGRPTDFGRFSGIEAVDTVLGREAGDLWLGGSPSGGVARLLDGRVEVRDRFLGLAGDRVTGLVEGGDGSLWVTTWDGGISRLSAGPFISWGINEGLMGEARSVAVDDEGTAWIGTSSGLHALDTSGDIRRWGRRHGLSHEQIEVVAISPRGRLAVLTSVGVDIFEDDAFSHFTVPGRASSALWESDTVLWIGTSRGLFRWRDGQSPQSVEIPRPAVVTELLRDSAGVMWAATDAGVWRMDSPEVGFVQDFAVFDSPHPGAVSMVEDAAGDLWVGSREGGLARRRGDDWLVLGPADGLPFEGAESLVLDDQGYLWVGSPAGAVRFDPLDVERYVDRQLPEVPVRVFDQTDGLVSRTLRGGNGNPAAIGPDGRVWMTSRAGLAVIDPAGLEETIPPVPRVLVESVVVDGEEQPLDSTLSIDPGHHRVQIDYTGIWTPAPERVRYRYRLVGLDEEWIEAGTRRTTELVGLPSGSFAFELTASLDGRNWADPVELPISVRPLVGESKTGQVGIVLVLLALLIGGARWSTRRLRKRAKGLESQLHFGRRLATVLDPEEVLSLLVEQFTEQPGYEVLVAARRAQGEAVASVAYLESWAVSEDQTRHLLDAFEGWRHEWILGVSGTEPALADRLEVLGATGAWPLLSGASSIGFVAVRGNGRLSKRAAARFSGWAGQAALALERSWQTSDARRWRGVSEARRDWLRLDLHAQLVVAAVAQHKDSDGAATLATVVAALGEGLDDDSAATPTQVEVAVEALVARGALSRAPNGVLSVAEAGWLLLPEVAEPLSKLAGEGEGQSSGLRIVGRSGVGGKEEPPEVG